MTVPGHHEPVRSQADAVSLHFLFTNNFDMGHRCGAPNLNMNFQEKCFEVLMSRPSPPSVPAYPDIVDLATAGYFYDAFAYVTCFYGIYFYRTSFYGIYFYKALKFVSIDCTVVRN
jgi:hypothetical protein